MARNTSRFNKILNFIGLVDEQGDENMDYDQGRPQGSSTYNPSSRRQGSNAARPVRQQGYDEPRSGRYEGGRYESPRYESSRYESPRYEAGRYDAGRYDSGRGYASGNYRGGDYSQQRSSSRDYSRNAPPRDEFEAPPHSPSSSTKDQRTSRPDTRSDYYSSRQFAGRDSAPPPPVPERGNVVAMHQQPTPNTFGAQTVIYYLHALEECRDVISDLLDNKTILLNLEDMDERLIQRGIDTLCGAAFALNATLRKASDKTYLIAPNTVNVGSNSENQRY